MLPSRRRTSTLCIACRTSTSFHLTVQVDPQRHFSFVYGSIYPRPEFSLLTLLSLWLHPLWLSSYSLMCVQLPVTQPAPFPSLPLCLSYLTHYYSTPPVLAGSVILISSDEWAIAHGCIHLWTDDCTLSLSCCLSCDAQNAPWITQNQRGTRASTVKETVTWRMETPGWTRRSWSSVKAWGALRDKSVVTLPPEVKICKYTSYEYQWITPILFLSQTVRLLSNTGKTDLPHQCNNRFVPDRLVKM